MFFNFDRTKLSQAATDGLTQISVRIAQNYDSITNFRINSVEVLQLLKKAYIIYDITYISRSQLHDPSVFYQKYSVNLVHM